MTHSAIPWTIKPAFRNVRVQRIMCGHHLIAETLDTKRDLYEVTVEPNKMLGLCRWAKNGRPINGIYVPAEVLHEMAARLNGDKYA